MPYVKTPGGELHYTVKQGPVQGPNLVLVHGAGGSRLHWPAELRRIAELTVYTLDLPGHGRSEGDGCKTIAGYTAAVVSFLDGVQINEAVVAGHSMGGAIAQTLTLQHRDRISKLVLIGTGARLRVSPAILEGIPSNFEEAVDFITEYAWSPGTDPAVKELGREALREAGAKVVLGCFLACHHFDVMENLADIEVPTLVINGTLDALTPLKYAQFLAEKIPDARLVTVSGAGHMVMLERPKEVVQAIREFVTAGLPSNPQRPGR